MKNTPFKNTQVLTYTYLHLLKGIHQSDILLLKDIQLPVSYQRQAKPTLRNSPDTIHRTAFIDVLLFQEIHEFHCSGNHSNQKKLAGELGVNYHL